MHQTDLTVRFSPLRWQTETKTSVTAIQIKPVDNGRIAHSGPTSERLCYELVYD